MKKFKVALSLAICAASLLTALPVYAANESEATSSQTVIQASSASVRAYEYEWHYKVFNGEPYKRKYNLTLDKYEGDWIPV